MNGRNVKRKISGNGIVALRLGAACAALLCLVAASAWAQSASPAPRNMLGVWQGFTQSYPSDPVFPPEPVVPVRSEITAQDNRRINGLMEVGGIDPQPFALSFNGTVATSDRVNLQGQDADHRGVAKLDLHDFGGGAAVLNGSLALLSPGGQMTDGSLLLLRPFEPVPDDGLPNPAGSYGGWFFNAGGTLEGGISAQLNPVSADGDPTSFTGQVVIVIGETRHTFELKGTINAAGRFIAIAQASAGHLIFDATWTPVPNDGRPAITGRHTLELNDGTMHEGTFSMTAETFR